MIYMNFIHLALIHINFFSAGYYCPTGSSVETEIICPEAMYCAEGSPAPVKCAAGTYTDYEGAETCDICPEGYFCIPDTIVAGM